MSRLEIERVDGVPIAHVREDIDAANAATIQQQLGDTLDPDALSLIVDFAETRYVDSAGIDMLLRLNDRLDHRRAKLLLVIPDSSHLKRLVTIVGLPEAIAIHPTVVAALQEAASTQAKGTAPPSDPRRGAEAEGIPAPGKETAGQRVEDDRRASLSERRGDERA